MPTVILLDASLSMSRPVIISDCNEEYQRRHLAIHGLNSFLDHLAVNFKLEFVSLVVFSSLWEIVVPFTRDFENVKSQLGKVEDYDKTCIRVALEGVKTFVLDEWGTGSPCQVILVTDGNTGVGITSLKHFLHAASFARPGSDACALPFPFPSKLHVMCLESPQEPNLHSSVSLYQKLVDLNKGEGHVFLPEGSLNLRTVQQMFSRLTESYYTPFRGSIRCGNLTSIVQLSPVPEGYVRIGDFDVVRRNISKEIVICGFMDINDVASPASRSRHLVLPVPVNKGENADGVVKVETESGDEEGATSASDDGKAPSFCVLLHGSLKVENMVAICQVGDDWYGMLYSWADSKKKSNLMLSIFEPGIETIPWLGNLSALAPASEFATPPFGEDDGTSPFPVRPSEKRSYAQSSVVWIRQSGLQADIHKILRHARKLPEKSPNFYKELNRLRRASLSFGFYELLDGLAAILDRECTLLPGTTHPDAALQLSHAANALRSHQCKDMNANILPLRTKFNEGDT